MTIRPSDASDLDERAFGRLMEGMIEMREEFNLPLPTPVDMKAVWAWARRARADEFESFLLANVLSGEMNADWQGGKIVFRLTRMGRDKVEAMFAESGFETFEQYMDSLGLHHPEFKRAES